MNKAIFRARIQYKLKKVLLTVRQYNHRDNADLIRYLHGKRDAYRAVLKLLGDK